MKLRLKCNGRRSVVSIEEDDDAKVTLASLSEKVPLIFDTEKFELSLNGKDAIDADGSTPLSELGIVSGDLVFVITSDTSSAPTTKTTQQLEPSTLATSVQTEHVDKCLETKEETAATSTADMDTMEIELEDSPNGIKDEDVNRYLREPMLIRESSENQVPQSLEVCYQKAEVATENEAIMVVLHKLMMECGFDSTDGCDTDAMPSAWKTSGMYTLKYRHPTSTATFVVTAVPMATLLVVHGMLQDTANKCQCSLQIKTSNYIIAIAQQAQLTYRRLPYLSCTFKDSIAHQMLLAATENTDSPTAVPTLDTVLMEVQLMVARYLTVSSLTALSRTCKVLHNTSRLPVVWRRLYLQMFGHRANNNNINQDWFNLFKEEHVYRQQIREQRQRMMRQVLPPFIDRPHPPIPTAPFYPPGFLGGDYDRDPHFGGMPSRPSPLAPRPRHDPIFGPGVPESGFWPGRGGGFIERGSNRRGRGGFGSFGPRFF